MRIHHPRHTRRGVALVEVILAALILGIGLSVSLSLATTSLKRQGLGEHNLTAAWLADEQMSMVLMEGPQQFLQTHPTSGTFDPPFDEFDYEVEIQHVGDYEPYTVEVYITWDGNDRQFVLDAIIAPRQGELEEFEDRKPLEPIDREAIYYEESID
ncbi:MAG: hypothetical protein MK116_06735 [Phycisphaerales bacterium]|nr:hypothetical protein [Phycisphaerales bacterium]